MEPNLTANPFYLNQDQIDWVHSTLASMTLEEKVGQLFCVNYREGTREELEYTYGILEPGGCMYRAMPLERAIDFTRMLRERARVPLLLAANLEKGGNGIVKEGTLFASPMEIAATDDPQMAARLAEVCAAEGGCVGANWSFAPIIDIDSNFRNPITNTRTFGSDPDRVRRMGVAYLTTLQQRGIAASIKHFPGDGRDERDQHLVTTINDLSCEEWDASYGKVYQACIDAGAMSCMVAQIMQPAYSKRLNPALRDEEILPASLSPELMQGLLRGKLGFNGVIVTDATTMAGFMIPMPRRQAVPGCIAAGADMFLFAKNLEEDYGFMLAGVREGVITPQRLDEAVTRILAMKAALGLNRPLPPLDLEQARQTVGCKTFSDWARSCADQAVTLVKEEKGVLPLKVEKYPRILFYPLESSGGAGQYGVKAGVCDYVRQKLEAEGFAVTVFTPPSGMEGHTPPVSQVEESYDLIVYLANISTKSNQTTVRIEWAQPMGANCPHYITTVPTVFISVENPYHLLDVPRVKTFINTYCSDDVVLDALVEKLMGRSAFCGKSPVDPFCGKWDTRL